MTVAPYSGWIFWTALLGMVAVHAVAWRLRRSRAARNALMISTSLAVIFLAHGAGPSAIFLVALLLAATALVYVVGKRLAGGAVRRPARLAGVSILSVALLLAYFKYGAVYEPVDELLSRLRAGLAGGEGGRYKHLVFLGVSYFAFKYIHFLVDCRRRAVERLDASTFFNYILFFPSFFAGPINRYPAFARDVFEARPPDVVAGGRRMITGLFKKVVLASSLYPVSVVALDLSDPAVGRWQAVVSVYAYALFVYFDFSGYTDLALGAGLLLGLKLPENFDYPFFRRNLQRFWASWHMSLTAWLTDYAYWPLVRKWRHASLLKSRPVTNSSLAIIVTFMLCGVWHGDGLTFLLWGTYHGVGLALLNAYTYLVKRHYPRRWRIFVKRSPVAYGVSNFVTVQYVVFGFLLFGSDLERLRAFFQLVSG